MSSSSSRNSTPDLSPRLLKRKKQSVSTSEANSSDSDASEAEADTNEPVLSHAERRRQKRAAKLALQKDSSPKKRKLEDGTAVPVPASKRQNSVWVGNLSFKTTQQNLRTFFESAGEITRVHLPTKAASNPAMKPENRGCAPLIFWSDAVPRSEKSITVHRFAYVDFATSEAKAAAIALSEKPLLGRKLLIKDGALSRASLE